MIHVMNHLTDNEILGASEFKGIQDLIGDFGNGGTIILCPTLG